MWSQYSQLKQDPVWGYHLNAVSEEAQTVINAEDYCALASQLSVIKVYGDDALSFLQGQLTCDFKLIKNGHPTLGAHCNVKGRVQSSFLAWHDNDCFYLALAADVRAQTMAELNKFAIFSKVTLEPCDDLMIAVFGGNSINRSLQAFLPEPPTTNAQVATDLGLFLQITPIGMLAVVPTAKIEPFVEKLTQEKLTICGNNAWSLHLIQCGVALVSAATSELWSPHELNYDLIDAVNFKKGCYKGQEIIARIQYRGRPKVRTYPLRFEPIPPIKLGDKLNINETTAGVVAVALAGTNFLDSLVTLKIETSAQEPLRIDEETNRQIQLLPLNYAIPK